MYFSPAKIRKKHRRNTTWPWPLYIDSNLNWRNQVNYIKKKVNRSIGILSKIRYYVNINTLINLYYSLVYPFLIYGLIVWGSTYNSTLNPLYLLQKRALRIMTFSKFDEHSSPLFKQTKIIKFHDFVVFSWQYDIYA